MTKASKRALRQLKLPSVRWSEQYRQFFVRIGYSRSRSGARQRAYFYLGDDERTAVEQAAVRKSAWRDVKRQARLKSESAPCWPSERDAVVLAPSMADYSAPEFARAVARLHAEQTADALELGPGLEGDGAVNRKPRMRVEQVRDLYLEYRKGKVGIVAGQGIGEGTYTNECRNLKGGLSVLDQRMMIDVLGYAELERLRDDIFRRVDGDGDGGLSKRSANNYWGEVGRMLSWAHKQSTVPYRLPEDAADLLKARFRNPNPIRIARYDAAQLKTLLKGATDRQRLYVLLALNCGHTQIDVGSLRRDEVVEYEGRLSVMRRRSKTKHQNDFEALHTLWDETAVLLKSKMAKSNKSGLALLSEAGTPLYRAKPHCDIISDTYLALQHAAEVDLPFKQFRKIGSTAIQRIGGDEARRLYKAGAVDSGDRVYVLDSYEKLTPHLLAWGEELRRDGVLTQVLAS